MSKTKKGKSGYWDWQRGSEVVAEWRASGLSMAAFARKRGLRVHRLLYWRDRVEGEASKAKSTKFVPGVVVGLSTGQLSVRLPRGVAVDASSAEAIDPRWVAALVIALEKA